jgi:hypothetical protein
MSTNIGLEQLRKEEYQQQLHVNRLRREVFQQNDPTASDTLLAELHAAERTLSEIEARRGEVEGQQHKGSAVLGIETTGLSAEVQLRMAQIPTSYYHLLDPGQDPLFTCQINNGSDETRRVRLSSYIEGYSARATDTAELDPGVKETFNQLPTLFPKAINDLNELTRATLNVLVEDLDTEKVEIHRTYPVWLLARTSAPLALKDPHTGRWRDMTSYLGAFVTPNVPALMEFLREAVDLHPDRRLVGYQIDKEQVEPQVRALFDALKTKAGIHYVNSVIDFSPDSGSANQRVRLPRESLQNKQANCIDGAVLFASLLEAISLSPAIVIIPGHAFVAWETWRDESDEWRYLETTMVGSHTFGEARESAEKLARRYMDLAQSTKDPSRFRLQPLRRLRAEYKITPME